ncbi:MAG: NAD(P)H-quinone oxidoreductase [Anaerolineales bacterium]|nr:NAD(P)H-quinone oxidoreductase [Anaerolineales bacterium]
MKAIVVYPPTQSEKETHPRLVWEEVPDVAHGPDEVLVAVQATAVNRADLLQAAGGYPPPPGASDILGLEMAGKITAVGENVRGWQVGDRVAALLPGGGYAQYAAVPAGMLMRLPETWTYEQGAAIPEVWLTAYVNLFVEGNLQAGETVLIHAGASGVGTAAIQLARASGARPFVTAGSAEKLARCRALGAELAVNYKEKDWLPAVLEATNGEGVNLILDPVGANYFQRNLDALAWRGRLVCIGLLSGGQIGEVNMAAILRRRLKVIGSTLRTRPLAEKIQLTHDFNERFGSLWHTDELSPIIDISFPIARAQEAHAYVRQNRNVGKVILNEIA